MLDFQLPGLFSGGYLLVHIQKTMENHNFNGQIHYKWTIFNSYIKLPEANPLTQPRAKHFVKVRGVSLPPNRRDHERHVRKINRHVPVIPVSQMQGPVNSIMDYCNDWVQGRHWGSVRGKLLLLGLFLTCSVAGFNCFSCFSSKYAVGRMCWSHLIVRVSTLSKVISTDFSNKPYKIIQDRQRKALGIWEFRIPPENRTGFFRTSQKDNNTSINCHS